MIDISVNLGSFKVNLDQLMDIKQGGLYEFNVDKDQDLELYIGEEKTKTKTKIRTKTHDRLSRKDSYSLATFPQNPRLLNRTIKENKLCLLIS